MLQKLMPKSDEFFDDFDAQCAVTVEGREDAARPAERLPGRRRPGAGAQGRGAQGRRGHAHRRSTGCTSSSSPRSIAAQIHSLLSRIDDVLDLTNAAAARLHYYEIQTSQPDADGAGAAAGARARRRSARWWRRCGTSSSRSRSSTGCKDIKKLETQADEVLRAGMGRLFKSGADPLTIIKWKEIYDLIETRHGQVPRTWPTSSRASCWSTPEMLLTARHRHHRGRAHLRLHQRLPRRGQLHRHGGVHAGAVAEPGRGLGGVLQLHRRVRRRREGGQHHGQGHDRLRDAPARAHAVLRSSSPALMGAIAWNLLTWWWGLPVSSSHALIGGL